MDESELLLRHEEMEFITEDKIITGIEAIEISTGESVGFAQGCRLFLKGTF